MFTMLAKLSEEISIFSSPNLKAQNHSSGFKLDYISTYFVHTYGGCELHYDCV